MLTTDVFYVGCIFISELEVLFVVRAVSLFLGCLERLVRPLMLTCMSCFAGGRGSDALARFATPAKLVVMYGCLEARRSYINVGPLGGLLIELASKPCQRLAIEVYRGSGLESVSVSESICSGKSA